MNWFYATKEKTQAGPVDEETLSHLRQSGTITAETLVWKEGMENWVPYASVFDLSTPPPVDSQVATAHEMVRCAECRQLFPPDQLISLAGRSICGSCKPVAVQKFQEGVVSFGRTINAEDLWKLVRQRGYDFSIRSVLSRTWSLVKGNFWPCLGVTLLCYLVLIGSQQIPILGILAVFLVQPQIMAGLNWYFLKQFRGETATLNDGFEGFRRGFAQQAIYMLIMSAVIFGGLLVCAIPMALLIPAIASTSSKGEWSSGISLTILLVLLIPVLLAIAYVTLSWIFTPLLILDRGLNATAAMKLSRRVVQLHFWKILGFAMSLMLLSLLGMLALCVGILVVLPVAFAAVSRLYEDIFGEDGGGSTRA